MIKRVFCLFLILSMLILLIGCDIPVEEQPVVQDIGVEFDIEYETKSNDSSEFIFEDGVIKKYIGKAGNVVIPQKIDNMWGNDRQLRKMEFVLKAYQSPKDH